MSTALSAKMRHLADRRFVVDVLMILLGSFIVAVGFTFFISPYKLVPGGVFGLSIVLHSFVPAVQIGTFALIIQVPLLIISTFVLGTRVGFRTLITTFATPLMINALSAVAYPTPEALHALDPTALLNGNIDLTNDLIITTIIGGVLVGYGTSLIIRSHASSGGTDIVAMIIHKFLRTKFSTALIIVDGVIVLLGLLCIGFGLGHEGYGGDRGWLLSFYALITMVVMNRSLAWGLSGNRDSKLIYIICDPEVKTLLRDWILHTLDRTATHTAARGLYSEKDKELIIMVVREREVTAITDQIRQIAPGSFVIVSDSYDVYGVRWSELPADDGMDFR